MRAVRIPVGHLLAAALLVAGCSYQFRNPAEALRSGEAYGRVGVQSAAEFEGLGGVSVGLLNSGFAEASRPTGAFTLLELPQGTHTLLFRQGIDRAVRRQVIVELGSDGQPEGVAMGDVAMGYTVAVSGTVVAPTTATLAGGTVVDEITGLTAVIENKGSFYFPALDVGEHRFRAFAQTSGGTVQQFIGGPLPVTLLDSDQRTVKPLSPIRLRAPGGFGKLRFRLRVITRVAGVTPQRLTVSVTDVANGNSVPSTVDPDGTVSISSLPEGVYSIVVTAPGNTDLVAPFKMTSVVLKDELVDLGSVYAVSQVVADEARLVCRSNDDCGVDRTCQAGQCSGSAPTPPVSPFMDICDTRAANQCPIAAACNVIAANTGCGSSNFFGFDICIPCETCCTVDGTISLCTVSGAGGCP